MTIYNTSNILIRSVETIMTAQSYSTVCGMKKTENVLETPIEPPLVSPFELQINEFLLPSSATKDKIHSTSYYCWNNIVCQYQRRYSTFSLSGNYCRMDLGLRCQNYTCACSLCTTCFRDGGIRCCDCPTA